MVNVHIQQNIGKQPTAKEKSSAHSSANNTPLLLFYNDVCFRQKIEDIKMDPERNISQKTCGVP